MTYRQVRDFNPSKGGTKHGYCLRNVRLGFGISSWFNDAWAAWGGTEQHKNRSIPKGVAVPLFYSYTATIDGVRKNWGHINVRLADGRIWNDGKIFASLSAFEKAWSNVKYVGWGESVNKIRVIKGEDMVNGKTAAQHYAEAKAWKAKFLALEKNAAKATRIAEARGKELEAQKLEVAGLKAEMSDLKVRLAVGNDDTELLNGLGTLLVKLAVRLGIKK